MAFSGVAEQAPSLPHLPWEVLRYIADKLEMADRVSLAGTCRALHAASVDWFQNDVFRLSALAAPAAEHVAWLGRLNARVDLTLGSNVGVIKNLTAAGAHIVKLSSSLEFQHVPAQLSGLTQLIRLSIANSWVGGGWQHLPRQLQELDLEDCSLKQVPAELVGLTHLTQLSLACNNGIEGGWQHLPRQLQELDLGSCHMGDMLTELAGLAQLMRLSLANNIFIDGWEALPPQLQELNLDNCMLLEMPAQLAGLTQLRKLSLRHNFFGRLHLPPQLQELHLYNCGLHQVPAELAGLTRLSKLCLASNPIIEGGWQHLPGELRELDLTDCGLQQVPAQLAGRRLQVAGCPTAS